MKRVDVEPTDRALVELLKEDSIGRNSELGSFADLLGSTEGSFTFFIDSSWGNGKTFFVRQLKLLLEGSNPQLETAEGIAGVLESDEALAIFKEISSFLPVYYNAWENDYWDDPLPTLGACIAAAANEEPDFSAEAGAAGKVSVLLDAFLEATVHVSGAAKLKEGFSSTDLIEGFRKRSLMRERVSNLVDAVKAERADTVLLIIDELDRCRPSFALRLLEEIKNLFVTEDLIVVCAVNVEQLAHTVAGVYGPGTDGGRYLSRFYDLRLTLQRIDPARYMSLRGLPKTEYYFDKISVAMVSIYSMSMRDANRYLQSLGEVRKIALGGNSNDMTSALFGGGFAPIILAMRTVDQPSYKKVVEELDIGPIKDVWGRCEEAKEYFQNLSSQRNAYSNHRDRQDVEPEVLAEELTQRFVDFVWAASNQSQRSIRAYDSMTSGFIDSDKIKKITEKIK